MSVILLGYRGCGKTSVGRKLALLRGWGFVDLDTEICSRFGGRTVAEIWKDRGEPAYREVEVQVTRELADQRRVVVALGGGTPMQPGAREVLEQTRARRIYLYCQPEELHRRISGDAQTAGLRPALTSMGGGLEEVQQVLAQRDPVYRAVADSVLDVTALPIDEVVAQVAMMSDAEGGQGSRGPGAQ